MEKKLYQIRFTDNYVTEKRAINSTRAKILAQAERIETQIDPDIDIKSVHRLNPKNGKPFTGMEA